MSNFTDFISSAATTSMPAMPRQAATSMRFNGGSFPAESLITADDFKTGDSYRIYNHTDQAGVVRSGTEIKRFDSTETEVWSKDLQTEVDANESLDVDDHLGITINDNGDLVVMTADVGAPSTTAVFTVLNRSTGASSSIISEQDFPAANGVWPGSNTTDTTSTDFATTNFDFYSQGYTDLTRTFLDVLSNGNYLFIGQSANNAADSEATKTSAIVEVNSSSGAIVSNVALTHEDGTTPINHPVQYRSVDGKILVGQIFSRYNTQTREFQGRFVILIRGNTEKIVRLPDDPERFFSLNRYLEIPSLAASFWMTDRGAAIATGDIAAGATVLTTQQESNPWFANGGFFSDGSYASTEQGLRAWPEPIKIWAMKDHIALTPCPLPNLDSSLGRVFIEGSTFILRTEFDQWLVDVCDYEGLST